LADKYWGEKEVLVVGLTITGLSTLACAILTSQSWLVWAAILFLTRTGASAVEIMKETYLFKKIDGHNTAEIGLSRLNSPFSSLLGPLFGVVVLAVSDFHWLFGLLGALMLLNIWNALRLTDTL
jgi:MFS family permease